MSKLRIDILVNETSISQPSRGINFHLSVYAEARTHSNLLILQIRDTY